MFPFPTPCKGKSKSQPFAHTFALTGRRHLCIDTQGVALGSKLVALSGRSFSHFVRLSCAHALPLVVWFKTAQRFIWILNAPPFRGAVASLPTLEFLNFEHPIPPHITQKAPRSRCCYTELSIYHSGNPAKDCPREYLTKYLQAVRRCRRL